MCMQNVRHTTLCHQCYTLEPTSMDLSEILVHEAILNNSEVKPRY